MGKKSGLVNTIEEPESDAKGRQAHNDEEDLEAKRAYKEWQRRLGLKKDVEAMFIKHPLADSFDSPQKEFGAIKLTTGLGQGREDLELIGDDIPLLTKLPKGARRRRTVDDAATPRQFVPALPPAAHDSPAPSPTSALSVAPSSPAAASSFTTMSTPVKSPAPTSAPSPFSISSPASPQTRLPSAGLMEPPPVPSKAFTKDVPASRKLTRSQEDWNMSSSSVGSSTTEDVLDLFSEADPIQALDIASAEIKTLKAHLAAANASLAAADVRLGKTAALARRYQEENAKLAAENRTVKEENARLERELAALRAKYGV